MPPETTAFEEKQSRSGIEPRSLLLIDISLTNTLPLGQTGPQVFVATEIILVAAAAKDTVLATSRFPINNRPN